MLEVLWIMCDQENEYEMNLQSNLLIARFVSVSTY
jgi:hypothetical protein